MNKELADIVNRVTAEKRLRVWSVILTFFGDAVLPRGKKVSAQTVSQLLQSLGIGDGAVRTAFSRLTSDGWVIRSRAGRSSFYELAEKGHEPFAQATTRIYTIPGKTKPGNTNGSRSDWILAMCETGTKPQLKAIAEEAGAFMPDTHLAIFNHPDDAMLKKLQRMNCLITKASQTAVPDWMRHNEVLSELAFEFEMFQKNFKSLPVNLPPMEAMAARCLLIHEWRRLVLKLPDLPEVFLPDHWPVRSSGELVAQKYNALMETSENWLDTRAVTTEDWNKPDSSFHNRFNVLQK